MFNTIDDLRNSREIIRDFWEKYVEIGETLNTQDMFVMSTLNRMTEINDAFNELTTPDNFNYLGAAPLVRLQIDTLLYTYAGTIADDSYNFLKCFLSGAKWSKLKDKEGNELKESFLVDKLCKLYGTDELKRIYKGASDFIHLSNSHLFMTLSTTETGISQRVGNYSVEENEEDLISIMFGINKLIFHILIVSYATSREMEMNYLKELQAQYPEKSTAELYAEFADNDDKLTDLVYSQLREYSDES